MRVINCDSRRKHTARKELSVRKKILTKFDGWTEDSKFRVIKTPGMNQSGWEGGILRWDPGSEMTIGGVCT